jgi:6-phosphogluconolactonase (cycloisomerase 2 family)
VSCGAPSTFTVNVVVSGLTGSGLTLRDNGADFLLISTNGTWPFATPVASGSPYAVTVAQQPTGQTCSVTGSASGTVGNGPVTVTMTCSGGASTFTIGGTVSGLSGSGLQLTNNGGNTLSISASGSFVFTTPIASGAAYAVAVLTQPSAQTCSVTNGSGTVGSANVTNVTVTCATSSGTRTIGGTVSGLSGLGLLLRNNGGDTLTVSANGAFTFATPLASGASYSVTVFQQPSSPTQTCTVSNGTGTVGSSNVTNVAVSCTGGGGGGGKFAFYSSEAGTPQVASYSVGSNGGLSQVSALPVQSHSSISGALATGVAVTAAGNYVIAAVDATDSANVDGELQVYAVNGSGQLSYASTAPVSHLPYCGSLTSGSLSCGIGINSAPETVLIHPSGRFVYVMDGVAGGACNPPGVSPCSPPAGFPASGNRVIVRYSFDPVTATLTLIDRHYVEGFVSFAMDPQGRFLWATSYLERKIYEFKINQSDGSLTFGTGTFIGMSNGDMWLGIDPNGNYAYAAHEGDSTIDSYTIDPSTGHLTNIDAVQGVTDGNYNKVTGVSSWGLAVSANGRMLYSAGGGVTAYALGADGRINASSRTSYNPATPLNGGGYRALVGVGSNGQYLYLQGYTDSAARIFSINSSSGALTETGASPSALASGTSGTTAIALQ